LEAGGMVEGFDYASISNPEFISQLHSISI